MENIQERIKLVEDSYKKSLEDNNLDMHVDVDFPQYRVLPVKVQLALQILLEEGVQFKLFYKEKE